MVLVLFKSIFSGKLKEGWGSRCLSLGLWTWRCWWCVAVGSPHCKISKWPLGISSSPPSVRSIWSLIEPFVLSFLLQLFILLLSYLFYFIILYVRNSNGGVDSPMYCISALILTTAHLPACIFVEDPLDHHNSYWHAYVKEADKREPEKI